MTSQYDLSSLPVDGPDSYVLRMDRVLIAAAAGDALGWMTESIRDVEQLRNRFNTDWLTYYRDWSKPEGGARSYIDRIRRGDYSDDTQLTLATARSLRGDGSLDAGYFAHWELPAWLDYARGAGSATLAAARNFQRNSVRWNQNFYTYTRRHQTFDYRDAGGNGAAMRVAPIALANLADPDLITEGVWRSAITTHGHPRAVLGALLYAHALQLCFIGQKSLSRSDLVEELAGRLERTDPPPAPEFDEWVAVWNRGADTSFANLMEKVAQETAADLIHLAELPSDATATRRFMEALGCFRPETKGSGTGTVLAALAIALQERDDVHQAIPWTINQLGSDTDTIGSFVGGLCGAIYGTDFAQSVWFYELQDHDGLSMAANRMGRIVRREEAAEPCPASNQTHWKENLPKAPDSIRSGVLSEGDWVFHHLFGHGKIDEIETQPFRNDSDGQVRLVRADFNNGQSCKFRSFVPSGNSSR